MHWFVLFFKIPFPGYEFDARESNGAPDVEANEKTALKPATIGGNYQQSSKDEAADAETRADGTIPTWMYFFLSIPAIFDLAATALCMIGLQYLDVSIYQMLRGSGIVFVALMKQYVLKEHLVCG